MSCECVSKAWIRCVDRLPNEYDDILMTYNDFVMDGKFLNKKFYHTSECAHVIGYCDCEEQQGITHWMPLPLPPTE